MGVPAHVALVREVAERSLTLLVNDGVFPRQAGDAGALLHIVLQKQDHDPAAAEVAARIRAALPVGRTFVIGPTTDRAVHDEARRAAAEAPTIVVSIFNQRTVYRDNGPLRDADLALVREVAGLRPARAIVMAYGNPYVAGSAAGAAAVLVGYGEGGFYGNQLAYADAFIRLMRGEIGTGGRLPVRVSERFPIGSGLVVPPRAAGGGGR